MSNNVKGKVVAAIMAFVMSVTALQTGGTVTARAAGKTKAMEINVDYLQDADNGDDSSVYLKWLTAKENVAFGKTYSLNMKIYVPATFMKRGRLWIKPNISFWTGKDLTTSLGFAYPKVDGYSFDKKSKAVKKYNDFYVIDAKLPVDICYGADGQISFPEGKGFMIANVFLAGFGDAYKGSIYIDDVALVVDGKKVAAQNYEKGKNGGCFYRINSSKAEKMPKVVTFLGKALTVSKTTLSVKKGRKATIQVTTNPSAKVVYKSSNRSVATVTSKGVVKGVKKGRTIITVKANGKTVKVKVVVK